MKKILSLLGLLLVFYSTFAIDYKELSIGQIRREYYKNNDFIFKGVPISINHNIVKFIISEQFKGEARESVIVKFENIESIEEGFSLWLIYGRLRGDTVIVNNPLSRAVNNAYIIGTHKKPSFTLVNDSTDFIMLKEDVGEKLMLENQWRNDFYDEIEILRGLKFYDEKCIEKQKKMFFSSITFQNSILGIILLIIIVLLLCILRKLKHLR